MWNSLTDLIDAKTTTPPREITATPINWHEVCSIMLKPQRRITSNLLMQDESAKKERKQIYVPLILVQKTKTDKHDQRNLSPDVGTRLYEPDETEQRFEHGAFLSQILECGEGKTKGNQIAVIGEPGAGKTTLLQEIAFWVLDKYLGFPIWISLADLGRNINFTDIETYILNSWLEQAIPPTQLTQEIRDDFINQIQQGRVWLLLDGVDEIYGGSASHQPLDEIFCQLTRWIGRLSRVVLTCRLNVWQADRNALETFETYRLLDFDYPQQVHQFIDNWFGKDSEKGVRLKAELDLVERVRLRDFGQTPLMLALLCAIWQGQEGNLPETKAGLHHQCVQQFYTWKKNCFQISEQEQRELNLGLGHLALRDINEGGSRFRLRRSFIIKVLGYPDDETSLFYKALQLGWLNHVGIASESPGKEKVYAFYHATFEEYFAALAVDDWHYFLNHVPENPEQGSYRIFEPQWKEVILLWLGREDIKEDLKEEFIKALVEFEDGCNSPSQIPDWKGFYEYRAYFLAAAGIAEFKNCSLADTIVEQIITWGVDYSNNQTQDWQRFNQQIEENSRAVLVETERKKATTALVELIRNSQKESSRRQAASILGKIAKYNPTTITALVELIENSQKEYVRRQAASILGEIAKYNPTAITALVELIGNSQSEYTRRQVASILGEIAKYNPTAITALVELIENSQSEYTRSQAASILGKIAPPNNLTAITALVELIENSQSEYTRSQAASILGKIAPPNNSTVITALVKLIRNSQSESTWSQAAYSLGEMAPNNSTAMTALVELIRNSQSESTRRQAAYSLGKIAPPNNSIAITALVELIGNSQSEYTRSQAVLILGKIAPHNPTTITALVELIRNCQSESTRSQAVLILGEIDKDNPTTITALVELIANCQSESTRRQAALILGKIDKDNSTAIAALVELIANCQSEYTRRQAALILGEIDKDNSTTIAALVELIKNSQSESTRRQAASILGEIDKDNSTAITILVKFIESSQSESTRRQAAYSLGKIAPNNSTAITALVELIRNSQSEYTRSQAASILGKIAPPNNSTVITALVKLIRNSQSEYTRSQVAYSLGEIAPNNSTAITALVELIRNSQFESTCRQAAYSLGKIAPPNNSTAITVLVELIRNSQSEYICRQAANTLGKIAKDNLTAITALVELIRNSQSESTRMQAAERLQDLLTESNNMAKVVAALKNDLSDKAYKVIWHCTQTMTYPTFYQAWHC
ncbi:MAG: HEAT repeat domain-containing protein [Nostoc sp.]|uniref:HEAT repeat domain-containing protein n=1 Tax=Nostoc sp. TaxID=1180 RepID=UPI002FF54C2F